MPSKWLKSYEEIKKIVCEKLSKTPEEVDKAVDDYAQKYRIVGIKDRQTLIALYAFHNNIHIPAEMPFKKAEGQLVKLEAINGDMKGFNVVGYVISMWGMMTKSKTDAVGFWLLDDTGFVQGRVYGEGANEMWKKKKITFGDLINIKNANTLQVAEDAPVYLTIGNFSEVEKIKDGLVPLDELCGFGRSIPDFEVGTVACVSGTVVNFDESDKYVGCPQCKKGLKQAKVGETAFCERCDEDVTAAEFKWIVLAVTDGEGDMRCRIPTSLNLNPKDYLYEPVKVYGAILDKDEMQVGFVEKAMADDIARRVALEKKFTEPRQEQVVTTSKEIKLFEDLFPNTLNEMLMFEDKGQFVEIRPRQYLGSENFSKIASIVRDVGGDYVSAGKQSHFRVPKEGLKAEPQKEESKEVALPFAFSEEDMVKITDYLKPTVQRTEPITMKQLTQFCLAKAKRDKTFPKIEAQDMSPIMDKLVKNGVVEFLQETNSYQLKR